MTTPASRAALIVLAKAPEPGKVKTRLCPPLTPRQAADLAAASLLDTLDATAAVDGVDPVVALAGSLRRAERRSAVTAALRRVEVVVQRGDTLGERIAAVHDDVAALHPGLGTLLIGMDTPQVTPALLGESAARLRGPGVDAVLGPAVDGGWWALGLRDPLHAALIRDVPTSRDDTGERTLRALRTAGLRVRTLPELTDVDTLADAVAVARDAPRTRLSAAVARLDPSRTAS